MIKRQLDKLLAAGRGRQLVWLAVLIIISFLCLWAFSEFALEGERLRWQDVMALYLDPGCFGGAGPHDAFRLVVVAFGVFLFSALLISVFTNIFDNISEASRRGERRYRLKGHTLFLGNTPRLPEMLQQFTSEHPRAIAAVMTTSDVGRLRDLLMATLGAGAMNRIVLYSGERDSEMSLRSACVAQAAGAYILGEPGETDSDSLNMKCLSIIRNIRRDAQGRFDCYVSVENGATLKVMLYDKSRSDNMSLEIINAPEYEAEQLLVDGDFLPAIGPDDSRRSHIVVFGTSVMASAFARVCAHISHYPNFRTKGVRTRITFVDTDMRRFMDDFIATHDELFAISRRRYVDSGGKAEEFVPADDFLDIEWEFIDSYATSQMVESMVAEWSEDSGEVLSLAFCDEVAADRIREVLYYGSRGLDASLCVWTPDGSDIIDMALSTDMYTGIRCFGSVHNPGADPLFTRRATRGMRVNHIYATAFGNGGDAGEAWRRLIVAHKYSSIVCANAQSLRERSFAGVRCDRRLFYECEHRRWMLSVLLMGYKAMSPGEAAAARAEGRGKELKKRFVHHDIVPYDLLSEEEKSKDRIIIDNFGYISTGSGLIVPERD
ncbi:MAG: hypothetical protein K2F97_07275 [Muribaculaceae bacterium]|nr:hypothetical protein [Muribaculaceae bacterium]